MRWLSVLRACVIAGALVAAPLLASAAPLDRAQLDIVSYTPTVLAVRPDITTRTFELHFRAPILAVAPGRSALAAYQTSACFQPTGHFGSRCLDWDGGIDLCPSFCHATGMVPPNGIAYAIDTSRIKAAGRILIWVIYQEPDGTAVDSLSNVDPVITIGYAASVAEAPPAHPQPTMTSIYPLATPSPAAVMQRAGAMSSGVVATAQQPVTRVQTTCAATSISQRLGGPALRTLPVDSVLTVYQTTATATGGATFYRLASPTADLEPFSPAWVPASCVKPL